LRFHGPFPDFPPRGNLPRVERLVIASIIASIPRLFRYLARSARSLDPDDDVYFNPPSGGKDTETLSRATYRHPMIDSRPFKTFKFDRVYSNSLIYFCPRFIVPTVNQVIRSPLNGSATIKLAGYARALFLAP
jgi:hypothetical protein